MLSWKQIIAEARPKLVLTTGTAGGIGKNFEVGDVVVSPVVRFDSTSWLKKAPFASAHYRESRPLRRNCSRRRRIYQNKRLRSCRRTTRVRRRSRSSRRPTFPSRS